MSAKIKVLDSETSNQIAAGEVVERPASVVKELIENAVDAQGTQIEIRILEGGIELIQVVDNGIGMNEEDARLSLIRHATSKLVTIDDLTNIQTLGFRGEALPSIASVSKFTLITRTKECEMALKLKAEGGLVVAASEAGLGIGTLIKVEDLFFNVPARRKFLKTIMTEGNKITEVVSNMALAYPDRAFKLFSNHKEVLSTNGSDKLKDVIFALYGSKISQSILAVDYQKKMADQNGESLGTIKITGFIGDISLYKSNRAWQTFFVNGRVIGSKVITKALDNAYSSYLPRGKYPFAVVKITMPFQEVDVNVHPQKSEVRFKDEGLIYKTVYAAVLKTLNEKEGFREENKIHPNVADGFVKEYFKEQLYLKQNEEKKAFILPDLLYKDVLHENELQVQEEKNVFKEISKECNTEEQLLITKDLNVKEEVKLFAKEKIKTVILGQFLATYIIAERENCLLLFDQHALHERLIYDALKKEISKTAVQHLVTSIFTDFPLDEYEFILKYKSELRKMGFIFDDIGNNTLRFEALPIDVAHTELKFILSELIKNLEKSAEVGEEELRHRLLQTIACKKAVKAGEQLLENKMRLLVEEFYESKTVFVCPHGRPLVKSFNQEECEKIFKRR